MREILFRGKDIKGNWYEGLLAHNIAKDEWYISNKAGISTAYQVRSETIGQFTGLTDKNGVKIFEGDIVEYEIGDRLRIGRVFFSDFRSSFSVTAGKSGSDVINNDLFRYIQNGNSVTVIGNIYDNPELIGGAERCKR